MDYPYRRFKAQAEQMYFFDEICMYNEDDLDSDFYEHFKNIFIEKHRGFGYWVWKPQVILQTLRKMREGDILLYADAGCHLNPYGIKRLAEYFEMANKNETGCLAFSMLWYTEKQWTKGDLFDYFDVRNKPEIYPHQIAATALLVKKADKSVKIIERWLKVFYDNFNLVDDTPSLSPNFPEFVENRHDQSIWSILVKINNIPYVSYAELEPPLCPYPILALRDRDRNKRIMLDAQSIPIKPIRNGKWFLKLLLPPIFIKVWHKLKAGRNGT